MGQRSPSPLQTRAYPASVSATAPLQRVLRCTLRDRLELEGAAHNPKAASRDQNQPAASALSSSRVLLAPLSVARPQAGDWRGRRPPPTQFRIDRDPRLRSGFALSKPRIAVYSEL